MKSHPVLPTSSFSNFVLHPPASLSPPSTTRTVLFVDQFLCLNGWSCHILCAILLNGNMDLHMSNLGTLVPERPWCVFYARRQVYWGLTHVFFTGTLIGYHIHTNTETHTAQSGASRLADPYKYIFTPPKIYFLWFLSFQKLLTCKSIRWLDAGF